MSKKSKETTENKKELYSLTPEHEAQLKPWHEKWVKIALRTEPQTDEDRTIMLRAINGLYEAANLEKPVNIVFSPSPLTAQVASGFAAAIWYLSKTDKNFKLLDFHEKKDQIDNLIEKDIQKIVAETNNFIKQLKESTKNPVIANARLFPATKVF